MATFGEVSWSDDFAGGGERKNNKDLFLRLDDGDNEVRIVTQPYQYLMHRYKANESDKYGQKVNCSAIHGSCPLCDLGDKAKPRWFLGVIDRKSSSYKILDISYAVFSQIRKLAQNKHWGAPTSYDINIVVDKKGGATGYYSVQPIGKSPLSAEDQVLKDNADLEDLKRRVTPPTPDKVQERMDKINAAAGNTPPVKSAEVKTTPGAAAVATVAMDDDELDEAFPSYDGGE